MFFEEVIKTRISKEVLDDIYKIVESDQGEEYDNVSHFVRCAIIQKIRVIKEQ